MPFGEFFYLVYAWPFLFVSALLRWITRLPSRLVRKWRRWYYGDAYWDHDWFLDDDYPFFGYQHSMRWGPRYYAPARPSRLRNALIQMQVRQRRLFMQNNNNNNNGRRAAAAAASAAATE